MISNLIWDAAIDFNNGSNIVLDISKWENVVVQFVTPSGAISFTATNDGGDVRGVSGENPATATNFLAVQGINLATGVAATSASADGAFRFGIVGKYLKLAGSAVTVAKLLIFETKPY